MNQSEKTLNVRPIRDFILLQPSPQETTTASGLLHLPKTASKSKTLQGTVLAVGPGRVTERGVRIEPEVRVGDHVVYLEYNLATKIARLDGEDAPVLLPESDIVAVIG